MSQTDSLGIRRFGLKEVKQSKSGESRLNKYLETLKHTETNNNEHKNENENGNVNNENERKSIKRKLSTRNPLQSTSIHSPPHKKIKLSLNDSNTKNIELCIEENIAQQTINSHSLPIPETVDNVIEQKENDIKQDRKTDKKPDKKKNYHPIYDITVFPEIKLPEIVNPAETLMPKPIWMQKGNKIISDICPKNINENVLDTLRLDPRLIDALKSEGYESYFPVQINVIPAVVRGIIQKRDIAVCAPTGSGKTLAYVLPICHILCKELSETSHHLRALVVAPSRDLAVQLFLVFEKFAKCVGLKVGLSAGQRSLKAEQAVIVNTNNVDMDMGLDRTIIDVLICSPGRLVDHLNHTAGFNLKNLQFLVFDEADRLLVEGLYQDWLFRVYHMIDSQEMIEKSKLKHETPKLKTYNNKMCLSARQSISSHLIRPYLLKILLSATLTHNPKVISSLKLNNPLYFGSSTDKKYLIPSSIRQFYIACLAPQRLLNIIALIDELWAEGKSAVCFCATVEIAHRLKRIVQIALNVCHQRTLRIAEFSRLISDGHRRGILREFRGGKTNFLVCSDVMSRGLDLPSLDCVINYELPRNVETYVHRVGRTARGNGKGSAFSIIKHDAKHYLKRLLTFAENGDKVKEYKMRMTLIRLHRRNMDKYTEMLNQVLNQEEDGVLFRNGPISGLNFMEMDEGKTNDTNNTCD